MAARCSTNKAVQYGLGFLCLLVLVRNGGAYEFVAGGQKGWSVPSDANYNPYNQWAEKSRFQVGDSLVFNYQSGQDSVLQVKSEDYANCNTDAPIAKFSDGHTVFKFNQSGSHFFISGNKDNCLKNEKIVVVVLANRNNRNAIGNITSPPPSPTASVPSPAPTGAGAQSPPSPAVESNPTPSPSGEEPPSNAASSVFVSFAGTLGAFAASALVLSL